MASEWNGLAIATLAVAAVTPVTVAVVGFYLARASQRLEHLQWANQTVITRRLDIFGEVGPWLNRLLCFATFVGRWKEISPLEAIDLKRKLDESMYSNRLLFSDELFDAYRDFMAAQFAMYATTGADAHVRAPIDSQWGDRRKQDWWTPQMEGLFSVDKVGSMDDIQAAYERLAERFRDDLYVTHEHKLLSASPSGGSGAGG
jgi:hypothetical protein